MRYFFGQLLGLSGMVSSQARFNCMLRLYDLPITTSCSSNSTAPTILLQPIYLLKDSSLADTKFGDNVPCGNLVVCSYKRQDSILRFLVNPGSPVWRLADIRFDQRRTDCIVAMAYLSRDIDFVRVRFIVHILTPMIHRSR